MDFDRNYGSLNARGRDGRSHDVGRRSVKKRKRIFLFCVDARVGVTRYKAEFRTGNHETTQNMTDEIEIAVFGSRIPAQAPGADYPTVSLDFASAASATAARR